MIIKRNSKFNYINSYSFISPVLKFKPRFNSSKFPYILPLSLDLENLGAEAEEKSLLDDNSKGSNLNLESNQTTLSWKDTVKLENSFIYFWKDYKLNINAILSESVLDYFILSFYDTIILSDIKEIKSYALILKLEFTDNTVKSISKVLVFNKQTSKNKILDLLKVYWTLSSEIYHLKDVKNIVISYRLFKKSLKSSKLPAPITNNFLNTYYQHKDFTFNEYSLPITTDLSEWGVEILDENKQSKLINPKIKIGNQIITYTVNTTSNLNNIEIFSNQLKILEIKDYFINGNTNPKTFERIIGKKIFRYEKGNLIFKENTRKVNYIQPIPKELYRTSNYITLDIETKNVNGVLQPVCISLYDGFEVKSFFISDYKSELDMVKASFSELNRRKYNYQKIFVHNLSNFDGVFLLRNLSSFANIKPLMRNGFTYNIKVEMLDDNKKYKQILFLRDSLLLIPSSLKKLSESFKIKNKKTNFPIYSLNKLPLDYIGPVPPLDLFKSKDEYLDYKKIHTEKWNLKKELIKYCENDVICLHQVINHFSLTLFLEYRIDIIKHMSLSSIAFAIYRSNFYLNQKICKIHGDMFKDIHQSYKGGLVDMYKPEGYNLFLYDVNSEYPEAMCKDMPGGKVRFFEGNRDLNDPDNFGFFKAEIKSNDNLNIPILPVKYKNTTICPTGTWTDWYFSEELKEAQNVYGYKIKILKGYKFERLNLFKEFVNSIYSKKEKSTKDEPNYLIFKLILNMLYGKFGMKPEKEETVIVNNFEAEKFLLDPYYTINDVMDLGNGKEILTFNLNKEIIDEFESEIYSPNISIAIASAVVSYGRIKINKLKHLPGIKVYYSDTDSIVTNKPLPEDLIGKKLGQLKLEDEIKLGYFIAPKLFSYLNSNFINIVKNKGFKNSLSFYELSFLLYKDTVIKKEHDKWYKNWSKGYIFINTELFSLVQTGYKRQLIYDSFNKIVDTRPFKLVNGVIINDKIDYIYNISPPNFTNKLLTAPKF